LSQAVLLEDGWQLRAAINNRSTIVAESAGKLCDSTSTGIVGRAFRPEPKRFPTKTREGKAQRATL
jgi:hypothetical protein